MFVRCFGSILFILLQFGRIGIVLYLPALALSLVTGMDVYFCILLMGLLCLVYTMLGGMEAVIWTDVAQVIILGGGAVFFATHSYSATLKAVRVCPRASGLFRF